MNTRTFVIIALLRDSGRMLPAKGRLPAPLSLSKKVGNREGGPLRAKVLVMSAKNSRRRGYEYRKRWDELIAYHGARCFYCRVEVATTIDHVVPYSYDEDNSIDNLVLACMLCNLLASDKHFEDVEQKRQYILRKREGAAKRRAICTECLLPFSYREHSPSMFLCAECYDEEYGKNIYSRSSAWKRWIARLYDAGIAVEAHRAMKERAEGVAGRRNRVIYLIDAYSNFLDKDPEFAKKLIYG